MTTPIFKGTLYPPIAYELRRGRQLRLDILWIAVARGIGPREGPTVLHLQYDDVLAMIPLPNPRISGGTLYAANTRLEVEDDEHHDSLVLLEWTGCSYRSPLVAWWRYKTTQGSAGCNWGDQGILDLPGGDG